MTETATGAPPGWLAGDRPARLYVLDLGLFHVDGASGRTIGIPGFLIATRAGRHVLIDTGFPPAYADGPDAATADGLANFGHLVGFTAENLVPGQLARLGLTTGEIDLLILTHSHIDHVGGIGAFTHCPILLGTAERAQLRPLYFRDRRPMNWPEARYITVDTDLTLCPGLTILTTPGHTAGHLSIHLDLPRTGPVILAGDAINRASEPAEGYPDANDPATAAESGARLLALAKATRALLIYGHDPAQWPGLPKASAFFD